MCGWAVRTPPVRWRRISQAFAAAGVCALLSRENVPIIGGRYRLIPVPYSVEIFVAEDLYRAFKADTSVVTKRPDPKVSKVFAKLERAALELHPPAGRYRWAIEVLVDDDKLHGFLFPGGKIAIYTGLLKRLNTEDEIAVVLSHDIGHAIARHNCEKVTKVQLAGALGTLVGHGRYDEWAYRYGFARPYSWKYEAEADAIGLRLATHAGFDPSVAPDVYTRITPHDSEWRITHPMDQWRRDQLSTWLPSMIELHQKKPKAWWC